MRIPVGNFGPRAHFFALDKVKWAINCIFRYGTALTASYLELPSSVQWGDTFLIFGGITPNAIFMTEVLEFDASIEAFTVRSETIDVGRTAGAAVLVDNSILDCSPSAGGR